jgi:hypothetical protein
VTESGYSCGLCKEKLVCMVNRVAGPSFTLLVRPRRLSYCRNYKPGRKNRVCMAEGVTRDEALSRFVEPGQGKRREVVRDQ